MSKALSKISKCLLICSFTFSQMNFLFSTYSEPNDYLEEAKRYLKEQKQEKAIETFLNCLNSIPPQHTEYYISTDAEKELYQKALALYFDAKGAKFIAMTEQIISEYDPIVESHPEYAELTFIVASAYANRGEFSRHFDLFYKAYYQLPKHYFAYKTQAILWIKLFERTLPGALKDKRRDHILTFLNKASEINPADTTLYRLEMLYAPDHIRREVVMGNLNKIIFKNIIISIADLEFYTEMAFDLNDNNLIRLFIDKASEWYPNSRIVARAQLKLAEKK